jgi:3',5'-cyclic AMP phosphodiesterase CpdA
MKKAILHISDLHFVNDLNKDKSNYSEHFKRIFFEKIKEEERKNDFSLKYLIISGDLSDSGKQKEYKKVEAFLNDIVHDFEIEKKNILICPGNHDINWDILESYWDSLENSEKMPYELHKKKFERFTFFYDKFFKKEDKKFTSENAVVDIISNEDDKLLIIGINSCFRESFLKEDHYAYIDEVSLKEKLTTEFVNKYEDYDKLIVMHHNPNEFNNKESEENWDKDVSPLLKDFPTIFSGHIHNSDGEGVIVSTNDIKYFVTVGSFSKKDTDNSFNIYYKTDNHKYKILYYEYANKTKPYWQHHDSKVAIDEVSLKILTGNNVIKSIPKTDVSFRTFPKKIKKDSDDYKKKEKQEIKKLNFNDLVNDLILIIQENKLFKTGHFQWSKDFKSFGIIDINYLVSTQETMNLISHLFNLRFNQVFHTISPDLIIGIGLEGNVIGARLSVSYPESGYSFIPDLYKNDDFSEFEHKIKEGNYNNIVLIKDILFNANNLKDLLNKEILKDKNIFVFSLFYCGKQEENELFSSYVNVKHYSICTELKINVCEIENVDDCPIVKYKLDTCYSLYTIKE